MAEPTTKAKDDSVGALWSKSTPTVGEYLSGDIMIDGKKVAIVCFLNKYKTEDKHPKYRVFLSKPRETAYGSAPQPAYQEKPSGALPGIPAGARPKSDTDDISIEEIPF